MGGCPGTAFSKTLAKQSKLEMGSKQLSSEPEPTLKRGKSLAKAKKRGSNEVSGCSLWLG